MTHKQEDLFPSSTSSPESEDSPSPSNQWDSSEQSDSQRSIPTQSHSSRSDGPMSTSLEPFRTSPEIQFLSDAVYSRLSSLVDFLASRTRAQGSDLLQPMTEISGMSALECFATYDPSSRSSKTSAGCLLLSQDFFSTEYCQTWPTFGTLANGKLYRQKTLELHTDENGSGSSASMNWLTPKKMEVESDPNFIARMGDRGDHCHPSLASQIKANWPTAVATDAVGAGGRNGENSKAHQGVSLTDAVVFSGNSGKRPNWPTARAEDGESAGNHPGAVDSLTGAMKMWPTVRASEYKDSGPNGSKSQQHMLDRSYLCATVNEEEYGPPRTDSGPHDQESSSTGGSRRELSWATLETSNGTGPWEGREGSPNLQTQAQGKLNPAWVECLQGYPIGYTQLSTAFRASRRSATPSSPESP
jgi:hypothetical protein